VIQPVPAPERKLSHLPVQRGTLIVISPGALDRKKSAAVVCGTYSHPNNPGSGRVDRRPQAKPKEAI
jgi:hypothetical protein